MPTTLQLFAPDVFPSSPGEQRAYIIAAFRIAQRSDQLSLIAMSKTLLEFLLKKRALGYWIQKGWLIEVDQGYRLTDQGLVICQSALADQLATHNTTADRVAYWENEFRRNSQLPRAETFRI